MMGVARKRDLTQQQLSMLAIEMGKRQKSTGTAWLLFIFTCGFAGHRWYLGYPALLNFLYIITLGYCGFGALFDLFTLNGKIRQANERAEGDIIDEILAYAPNRGAVAKDEW